MSRAAVKVQGAQKRTLWTLRKKTGEISEEEPLPPYTPHEEAHIPMQDTHDHPYYDQSAPSYESCDGSGYDSPDSSRTSSVQFSTTGSKPTTAPNLGRDGTSRQFDDFDIHARFPAPPRHGNTSAVSDNAYEIKLTTDTQLPDHSIRLNTKMHAQNRDTLGLHLLYENALLDSRTYEILDINEVDALKKEHARLNSRIDAANRKLALESKLKDAAQNLSRLYSSGKKDGRPDTPQSPDSRRSRSSLVGNTARAGTSQGEDNPHQAEDELAQSIRKVDELNDQLRNLMDRRQDVERKLLRHTAAVLAEQASRPQETGSENFVGMHSRQHSDDHGLGIAHEGIDEFDGIRDILKGLPASNTANEEMEKAQREMEKAQREHEQQLVTVREQIQMQHEQTVHSLQHHSEQHLQGVQVRLDRLNEQLQRIVTESKPANGQVVELPPPVGKTEGARDSLDSSLMRLEHHVQMLEQAPQGQREQESARDMQDEVEQQLEGLNQQLHQTLQTSAVMEALKELREPPEVAGNGYQDQVEYLEETLVMVEKIFQEHHEQLDIVRQAKSGVEEAQNAADKHLQRVDEYETVIAGLWEILSAEPRPGRLTPQSSMDGMRSNSLSAAPGSRSPTSPIREDFSLQAFSARVQHLSDVANGAREQQEILRRQIQQQRDLNGKTDMEKNREVEELQARYEALNQSYDATQHELTKAIENHAHADQEAREAQAELSNAMEELEQLRQTVMDYDDRNKEIEEREQQLDVEKKSLSAAKDAAEEELARVQKEMQDMESELVRLTTELTMSKAELEGAYGTRAERQKEAGAAEKELDALAQLKDQEIAQLRREQTEKTRLLEQELQDMMGDFQEMTRESLELEKERGQLETLIDSLRERVEQLETQLDDDRIRHIGLKPPGTASGDGPRETTSVTVLRQEFKKMMRESRMEAVKLLKAEREERRALETEVRKMRQLNSPLGRQSLPGGHSAKNSLAHIRFGSISSNSNPVHGAASASATATSAPGMSPGASTAGYSAMAHAMSAPGTVIE